MDDKQQPFEFDFSEPASEDLCDDPRCRARFVGREHLFSVPHDLLFPGEATTIRICQSCLVKRPSQKCSYQDTLSRIIKIQQAFDFSVWRDQITISNPTGRQYQAWNEDTPGLTYILRTNTQHVYKIGMTNVNVRQRLSDFRSKAPGADFVHALYSGIPRTLEIKLHDYFLFEDEFNPNSSEIVVLSPQALEWLCAVRTITVEFRYSLFGDEKTYAYEVKHSNTLAQCNVLLRSDVSTGG